MKISFINNCKDLRRRKTVQDTLFINSFLLTEWLTWNSLPYSFVHAKSTDTFNNRLDKFSSNQEMINNYHAKIHVTTRLSVIN